MSEQDQPRREAVFSSQRVVRKVPLNWEHPKDEEGKYVPLYDRSSYPRYTEEEIQELLDEGDISSRDEIEGWFAPDFSNVPPEEMGICAYEEVTEGTPISPVFPDSPEGMYELVRYCAENRFVFGGFVKADVEGWAAVLWGNAVVDPFNGVVMARSRPPDK